MSIYAQDSCTLSTITDVKAIYTYHCLISGTYNPGMAPNDNISPLNSSNQVKDSITITYNSNTYTWTLTEPGLDITNIDLNKLYYIDCVIFSNNTYDWGPALVSSSYEAAKQAYNKANVVTGLVGDIPQHFWWLTSPHSSDVPAGAYITDISKDTFKDHPENQSNLLLQSGGISLRYGADTKAQLTSSGLKISQGGVDAGTSNTNNYVYISSENGPRVEINGYTPPDPTAQATLNAPQWREIIGTKFGVLSDGTLYASNANIDGNINAQSLTIGSGQNTYNGIAAINASGYEIAIVEDSTGVSDPSAGTILYPHMYHNGVNIDDNKVVSTDTTVDSNKEYWTRSGSGTTQDPYVYTQVTSPSGNPSTLNYYEKEIIPHNYIWYQDDVTPGTSGAVTDGHYSASYGHRYKVIYDFDDGAVGEGVVVQTREIDPEKYITKISDTGITIHPEDQSNNNYVQLDANSLKFYQNNINVAEFGASGEAFYSSEGGNRHKTFSIDSTGVVIYKEMVEESPEITIAASPVTYVLSHKPTTAQGHNSFGFACPANGNPIYFTNTGNPITYQWEYRGVSGGTIEYDGDVTCVITSPSSLGTDTVTALFYYEYEIVAPSYDVGTRDSTAGKYSAVIGEGLQAIGDNSVAVGKYNNDPYGGMLFSVGNGADDSNRSNAMTVDWSGNVNAAGEITDGGGNVLSDKIDVSTLAEYITEIGSKTVTEGTWTWRKYNTGKIEARIYAAVTVSSTTARGNYYYGSWSLDIPSDIGFTSTPESLIGGTHDSVTAISINGQARSTASITGQCWRYASSSNTITATIGILLWQN